MKLTGYKRCPSCGSIYKDVNNSTTNYSVAAPCCRALGGPRELWPSLDVLILLDIVEKQNLNDYKEAKVAIVFISTLLEMLLEESLITLLKYHVKTEQAADALLESNQGRKKRIDLFGKISGLKFSEFLTSKGYINFNSDWKSIATLRNKVVHRGFHGETAIDIPKVIGNLMSSCMGVFAEINNEIINTQGID